MPVVDTGKIARNTLMLYIRMGLIMLISLYTSRVILDSLGAVDFGIYNSVGGIVAMFSFLSGTLSTSCQRYFMVELGKGDMEQLRRVFSMCLVIFIVFSLALILVIEPFGLWFVENKMKLEGRLDAARWVYHCSLLSFAALGVSLPFQAMVIAREKMGVFAWISVFEALGALGIAFLIKSHGADRLVLYSILMLAMQMLVALLYAAYCLSKFRECRPVRAWDKAKFREIFSFTGWNLLGSGALVFKVHGSNLLLNMFYGPAVNAARGMAMKVYNVLAQLRENFITASKPQLMMSFAAGQTREMKKLVYQTGKFSNYLLMLLAVPFILEMPFILGVWLKEVPQYTALFAIILLVNALIEGLDTSVCIIIQANGDMKKYQLTIGILQLCFLPVAYLLLKFGTFPPQMIFILLTAFSAAAMLVRLYFAKTLVGLKPGDFFARIVFPVLATSSIAFLAGWFVQGLMQQGWLRFLCVGATCVLVQALSIWTIGMTVGERQTVVRVVKEKLGLKGD